MPPAARWRRPARPLRLPAVALVAALAGAGCGDDATTGAEGAGDRSPTTATTLGDDTTTDGSAPTATGEPSTTSTTVGGAVVEVAVEGGEVVGGVPRRVVPAGGQVTLHVESDVVDELHVHGYDLEAPVGPGAPAELTFTADLPGVWEVELHDSGLLLAQLEVR